MYVRLKMILKPNFFVLIKVENIKYYFKQEYD